MGAGAVMASSVMGPLRALAQEERAAWLWGADFAFGIWYDASAQ